MDSRVELEPKLHFFEHYSLQKGDEFLRNALYYSLDILCNRNPAFVRFRYYVLELTSIAELAINAIFLLTKNGSFSEYLYSYKRNNL